MSSPGAKPVPPPRDHLRIEKDGRLVNRAPAPQVPARIVNNNNVVATTPVSISKTEPTKEQLDSIRKFQVSQSNIKQSLLLANIFGWVWIWLARFIYLHSEKLLFFLLFTIRASSCVWTNTPDHIRSQILGTELQSILI